MKGNDNKIIAKCKVERTKTHNKFDILRNSTEEKSASSYYFNIILHIASHINTPQHKWELNYYKQSMELYTERE